VDHFEALSLFNFNLGSNLKSDGPRTPRLHRITGDADIYRPEQSMLSHEQVGEVQVMDIDNPPLSRTLDSRALPRLAANQIIKTKRKTSTTSVRQQLQSFAKDPTAHQTRRPEKSLLLVVRQSYHTLRAHRSKVQHKTYKRDP
jgi:hypothetical protein